MVEQAVNTNKIMLKEKGLSGLFSEAKILKIDERCLFKTKLEDLNEVNNSIFKDVYLRAIEGFDRIIDYVEQNAEEYYDNYDYNNVISFIGNRGSGKTSTMKSFRNSLDYEVLKNIEVKEYKEIKENRFELLNIIDSRSLSDEKSILEIIVYNMYKNFKDKEVFDNITDMIDLDNEFNKVYNDISLLKGDRNEDSNSLAEITSLMAIKEHIKNLVDKYIDYMSYNKIINNIAKNKFLVISIDNFDISSFSLKKSLNELRKYLSVQNIIILMTVNFKEETNDEINILLENVIPYNRRIYIKSLNLQNLKLEIDRKYFRNIPNVVEETAQQTIISILFLKLNYIIATQKHFNSIIPSNLSKFIELIIFLDTIKNEYPYEKKIEITYMYLEKEVIKEVKDEENRLFLKKFLNSNSSYINKQALTYINSLIYENKNDLSDDGELWDDISYVKEKKLLLEEGRINLGDIVTWIKRFENLIDNDDERKFIEIFKVIYTIKLLEIFYTNPEILLNKTGFDFSGKYFNVALNKHREKLSRIISVDEEYALGELKYCFKSMNNYLLSVLLHPVYDSNLPYARLTRSENKSYVKLEDISNFNKFEVNYLNIVGYILYEKLVRTKFDEVMTIEEEFEKKENFFSKENINYRLLFVINIDLWIKTLEILDIRYKNSTKVKKDFLIEAIDMINRVFETYSYRYRFNKYGTLIGTSEINEICNLYEVFEKIYYLHKNKY
ncbi:DUF815 domain-containing protein [Clostridium sp. SHJSY1]|uniref:DUF815 domain-containing protein n=1 Tax=Clostridium sp. SHJSY1 TaxID=2942483 RepID=UPI00287643E9|nr:DUF815 domain-containing protein [Clostridium sp. SHJSY1]MDS0524656.1 DUF815 domain-containing protein [Clostridium sp. SHJSY1]